MPAMTLLAQSMLEIADQQLLPLGFQKEVEKTRTIYKYTYTQLIELGVTPEILELQPLTSEEKDLLKKYEVRVHGLNDFAFMRYEITNAHQQIAIFTVEINHFKNDVGKITHSIESPRHNNAVAGSSTLGDEMYAWEFRSIRPLTSRPFSISLLLEFVEKFPSILAQIGIFYERMKPSYVASELEYIAFNRKKIADHRKYRIILQTIVDALKVNSPNIPEEE